MTFVDCRDRGDCRYWTTQGNCGCPYCGTETLRRVSSRYSAYADQYPLAPDVPGDGHLVPMSEREVDAARAAGWWVSEPVEAACPPASRKTSNARAEAWCPRPDGRRSLRP